MLPRTCDVSLNVSGLSLAVLNRLSNIVQAADYTGPRITYSRQDASRDLIIRPLHLEVDAWKDEAPTHQRAELSHFNWGALPSADNANAFSTFLARVRETSDYRFAHYALKVATQSRVAKLLVQLQSDPTLRENCFNLALDAVNTCGDRVAMRLMDMENLAVTSTASAAIEAGEYDDNPQALVELCKGQHRLALIKATADDKVATMNLVDLIEVHLGYITKLAASCSLPVQISTMLYPHCARITDDDLAAIRKKLSNTGLSEAECAANNGAYHIALAGSVLMRKFLQRLRPIEMNAINAHSDQMIMQAQNRLFVQMESLRPDAPDYRQQSLQLKAAFNALQVDIPAQATLSLLLDLMALHGIECGLDDAVTKH